ncbi:MAG: hypothetical protein A3F40_02150 [Chlamydiae bacterium RIFCSPHIGHO2_12_FULL_27_8]|nr:MAG: hypothetical protein A3F40_02150 [Chlamydiae bacterium RIFCSPHIGHO2_12_FULL_27_8]
MLKKIREEIDFLDNIIIDSLKKRFELVVKLKNFKKEVEDKTRESEILNKIDSENIKNIYLKIFEISKKIQS